MEEERQWYVIHTYSGYENKVKANLERKIQSMGMQTEIFQVLVPMEDEVEIKDGKRKITKKKIFPGYVLVEMIVNDRTWYVVRNTPGVTGFIGSSGGGAKPFPVSPVEMESILRRMGQSDKKVTVDFEVGDMVKILTGPFSGMEGKVSAMNDQTQTASVMTMLFGRETPTDIAYNDLEKVKE